MTTETKTAYDTVKEAFAPMTDALKNLQNLEVPEAAREFVKKTAGTAKERAADLHAGSEKVTAVIETTVADLRAKGAEFRGAIEQREYGRVVMMAVPGADDIQLYEPSHKLAYNL